jgi:hypothetical protein
MRRSAQHNSERLSLPHRQNQIGHTDLLLSDLHTNLPWRSTHRVVLAAVQVLGTIRS